MADMTTLQQSLINAKKVMSKVDDGNFTKGSTQRSIPMGNVTDSTGLLSKSPSMGTQPTPTLPNLDMNSARKDLTPKSRMTEAQIKNSKLPEAIKQAMINNPIPDVPWNGSGVGLSEEFLSGVKNEMNKQGMATSPSRQPQQSTLPSSKTKKLSSKNLKSIIKESVKEILDEVVSTKINESIGLRTDMNENFQFRVGDKVFYGKITSTKTVK